MRVYAGIDEAGYGPKFGPLTVGRSVFALPDTPSSESPPDLWDLLGKAVCRTKTDRRGRLAVNDSKKLYTPSSPAGVRHLERAVLAASAAAWNGKPPASLDRLLDRLGETSHRKLHDLPWYAPTPQRPWQALPDALTAGEAAIDAAILRRAADVCGVRVLDLGAAVVFEDRFNQMVQATRSKASASFTFVAGHCRSVWDCFAADAESCHVAIDRQSGRSRYREPLAQAFPEAEIQVLGESDACSAYRLTAGERRMTVSFETESDARHLPVALASMLSKYTRELLLFRFQAWFADRLPDVKPTAGYGKDAGRFWQQVRPALPSLGVDPQRLLRIA